MATETQSTLRQLDLTLKKRIRLILLVGCLLIGLELSFFADVHRAADAVGYTTLSAANAALTVLTVVKASHVGAAMSQTNHVGWSGQNFHWDWHAQQEMGANDSLRKVKIPAADRKAISAAIAAQLRSMMKDLEIESEVGLEKTVLDTSVKLIDLNGDGVREVIAQGTVNCSAVGNCPIWVIRKKAKGYQVLLEDDGQTFTIQQTSTGGYRDIVIAIHGSATQAGLTDCRFRDGRYQETGCYGAAWAVLEGDKVRDLKEPQIRAFPCRKN